jgi:hypothetical protein
VSASDNLDLPARATLAESRFAIIDCSLAVLILRRDSLSIAITVRRCHKSFTRKARIELNIFVVHFLVHVFGTSVESVKKLSVNGLLWCRSRRPVGPNKARDQNKRDQIEWILKHGKDPREKPR